MILLSKNCLSFSSVIIVLNHHPYESIYRDTGFSGIANSVDWEALILWPLKTRHLVLRLDLPKNLLNLYTKKKY